MSSQVTPEAFYDSLSIGHKLDNFLDGFKLEEIHLFSYFSSLLYLYGGNPISTWTHRYIASNGYPFSNDINEAIQRHIINGLFEEKNDFYTITTRGADELSRFSKMSTFVSRELFLDAACTTSLIVPYSEAIRALLTEPELRKVEELKNNSWLQQMAVYPKLKEISEAVGVHSKDLVLPAVTWVTYLTEKNKQMKL